MNVKWVHKITQGIMKRMKLICKRSIGLRLAEGMGVELLWRRPNAPSVALRGGLRLLRLAEFVRYNWAAIGGPSKRQPMNSLPKLSHKPPRSSCWCIRIRQEKIDTPPPEYSTSMAEGFLKDYNGFLSVIWCPFFVAVLLWNFKRDIKILYDFWTFWTFYMSFESTYEAGSQTFGFCTGSMF